MNRPGCSGEGEGTKSSAILKRGRGSATLHGNARKLTLKRHAKRDLEAAGWSGRVRGIKRRVDHFARRIELERSVETAELRVIERVVRLQAELAGDLLAELHVAIDREIPVVGARQD